MTEQEHLLACLSEECAEVIQRIDKIFRFGMDEIQPGQVETNRVRLVGEVNDLLGAMELLSFSRRNGDTLKHACLPGLGDRGAINAKKAKILEYMEYARSVGTVEPTKNPALGGEAEDAKRIR